MAEWYVAEGDSFSAGDALAKIETDKASIEFESQDDAFVAKVLQEAGTGADIEVGAPIMVTVEKEEHIAAFKDFVVPAAAASATPKQEEEEHAPAAAVSSPPPPPPTTTTPAEPVAAAAATPPPPPPPPPVAATPTPVTSSVTPAWGMSASTKSPLSKTLAAQQLSYIEKYGSTGQRPLAA